MIKSLVLAFLLSVFIVDTDCRSLRLVRQTAPANDFFGFGPIIRTFMSRVQPLIASASVKTVKSLQQTLPLFTPVVNRSTGKLSQLPFCHDRATSGICPFMTCTLESLKDSKNLENLELLTQVMADPELRASVAESPEIVDIFCESADVDPGSCKAFQTLIKVLDKVMTVSEKGRGKNIRFKRANDRDKNNDGCDDYYEYGGNRCGVLVTVNNQGNPQNDPQKRKFVIEEVDSVIEGSGEDPLEFEFDDAEPITTEEYYNSLIDESEVDVQGLKGSGPILPSARMANCRKYLAPNPSKSLALLKLFKFA